MEIINSFNIEELTEESVDSDKVTIEQLKKEFSEELEKLRSKIQNNLERLYFPAASQEIQPLVERVVPKTHIPKENSVVWEGNRKFRWVKQKIADCYCDELKISIKNRETEGIVFGDIFAYHDGNGYVKLFKQNITPIQKPEDEGGEKFPTPNQVLVLSQIQSEKAVETSAKLMQKLLKL